MKLVLGSFFFLCSARGVLSGGTDLGGGIVTRTDVEYWADLTLDIRDIEQNIGLDGGSDGATQIYLDGRNAEPQVGEKYKLVQLSTDLSSQSVSKASPGYLFHLHGLSDRSTDPNKLMENGSYSDNYIRSSITQGQEHAPKAILVLSMWMYASHVLYEGVKTCQIESEADNPSQFKLKMGGLDTFIALWIGTGQAAASKEGHGLYALAEQADDLFDSINGDESDAIKDVTSESYVNRQIKLLYQQGASLLSLDGVCTKENPESPKKLWAIASQIMAQMHVPLIQMLIISIMEEDTVLTEMYAMAVVPQASHCKASAYKRLHQYLLKDSPDFSKTKIILNDLYDLYACFGLTCDDIGTVWAEYDIDIPDCVVAVDNAPMALYNPTTEVHPVSLLSCDSFHFASIASLPCFFSSFFGPKIARIDLDISGIRTLTSLGAFDYAKLWYMYGRNSVVQRDSDNDPYEFYSLSYYATAASRKNADPYYTQFVQYYDSPSYADTIVRDALEGKGKWGSKGSVAQRSAIITETCAFQILYLHLIAQMHDAVKSCEGGVSNGEYDLTHPWDEVAALLIGSIEGTEEGGSTDAQDGQLVWGLATRRGYQFKTLNGKGYAKSNSKLEDLLFSGRGEIDALQCDVLAKTVEDIRKLTMVPLMQSVVRYGLQNEKLNADSDSEDLALGEAYALAIIPIIRIVDPGAAAILEENMVFREGIDPVRDGSQEVADAIGNAAVAEGMRCSMLGSTPEAKPCAKHSAAGGVRPLFFAVSAAIVSLFFAFW